jgi:hypothetical protein
LQRLSTKPSGLVLGAHFIPWKFQGDLRAQLTIQRSWQELPTLFYLFWQELPNLKTALESASLLREWLISKGDEGRDPHAKVRYMDGDQIFELEVSGPDVDTNQIAELLFKHARLRKKSE